MRLRSSWNSRRYVSRHEIFVRTDDVSVNLQTAWGVSRSLAIYYGRPWRFRRMDEFYSRFLRPGDLAFDIGAHLGNRIRSWRKLGARVVAVEPQPALVRMLRLLYSRDAGVQIVAAAVASAEGRVPLHLNLSNPTISTTSVDFIAHAAEAPSFHGQRWQKIIEVRATTLDGLIAGYGPPHFVKIDIEGFEAEALHGLSQPPPALSVEFVPMHRKVIEAALDRLAELGDYRFNATYGDEMRLLHPHPLSLDDIRHWLRDQGSDGPAGDLYAGLDPIPLFR